MQPAKSPYTRDFKRPTAPQPAATDEPVKTEVVNDIPVRAESQSSQNSNPITHTPAVPADTPVENDRNLDQILTDVNREVGRQSADTKDSKLPLPKKKETKKPAASHGRPVVAITVAIIVVVALFAAAYSAFKGSGG